MGLQVRLRHALGERVLELPDRAVDHPIVVGRSSDADVQVPSINIGQRHLVLFVHEGQWVVQNGPDTTGTTVNGSALPSASVVQAGDVLTLGSEVNAPTIQIEAVSGGEGAMAPTPYQPASLPPPTPEYAPPVISALAPAYVPPAPVAREDDASWMTPASTPASSYTRKKRKSSDGVIAFAMISVIAIVSGAGAYIYIQKQKSPGVATTAQPLAGTNDDPASRPAAKNAVSEKPATAPKPTAPPPPPDITDELNDPAMEVTENAATRETPSNVPDVPMSEFSDNPENPDEPKAVSSAAAEAFKRVESAYWATDPAKCLLALDSFEAEFPGVETKKIEQYREDMLDKAWWIRIDSLLDKQKELEAAIKKTEKDIKDETEAAFKKTVLEPRLADQKARLIRTGERLTTDMNYKELTAPPIGEETKLQPLRAKRDKAIYDAWKTRILKYVRDNHGAYPWATER